MKLRPKRLMGRRSPTLVLILLALVAATIGCAGISNQNVPHNTSSASGSSSGGSSNSPSTLATSTVASNAAASGAVISWATSAAATSQVEYGLTANYDQSSSLDSSMVTSHSVALSGLTASTLYHYRVKSADASGNLAISADFVFATRGFGFTPLSLVITAPAFGATVSGTVTVTTSTADSNAVTGLQYQLDGANIGPVLREPPYSFFWDTSTAANGSHTLTAIASDSAGNSATSSGEAITVLNNSSSVVQVTPTNWCAAINSAAPGTTIVLGSGSFTDSCHITSSGTAAQPITVRGISSSSHAALTYNGSSANVIDLGGSYMALRWLTLGPSQSGIDGIRIRSTHDDVIEENLFQSIGGVGVPGNDSGPDMQRIAIRNNVFNNGQSTVIYLGCHDGVSCHALDVLVESNLIVGALPGDGVGSGVQIKLNSFATVRDNTIYNTTGAGVIIYGSNRGDPASLAEGNYVEGAQNDAGINAAGGPVIVRNNVVVGNGNFGVWAQDYNGRNLQSNVWIVHNTSLNNQSGGIGVQNWQAGRGNVLAYNAITPISGTSAFPSPPGSTVTGNATCSPASACFDQASNPPYDLWPITGGPLVGAAGGGSEPWRPFDDFMGVLRGAAADLGAFQRTGVASGPAVGAGKARPPRSFPLN